MQVRHLGEKAAIKQNNKERPPELSPRDERRIINSVSKLRNDVGYFTSKRVKIEAGF